MLFDVYLLDIDLLCLQVLVEKQVKKNRFQYQQVNKLGFHPSIHPSDKENYNYLKQKASLCCILATMSSATLACIHIPHYQRR